MISIIIPVYNEEKYLDSCLESIVPQYFHNNIEIIIIDDGSDDHTLSIARKFQKYGFIHICHNEENRGLSYCRNMGMACAKGDYIMFVDGDDLIAQHAIENIHDYTQSTAPDVIVGMLRGFAEPGVDRSYTDPFGTFVYDGDELSESLVKMQEENYKIAPSVKYIVSKSFLKNNRLHFESIYHEDQLWSPILLALSQKIEFLDDYFYYYRLHNNGLSQNVSFPVSRDYLYTIDRLIALSKLINESHRKDFLVMRAGYLFDKIINTFDLLSAGDKLVMKLLLQNYSCNIICCRDFMKQKTFDNLVNMLQ